VNCGLDLATICFRGGSRPLTRFPHTCYPSTALWSNGLTQNHLSTIKSFGILARGVGFDASKPK
jgi:hypothetical protein